jgi:hypothetical protein
MNPIRIQAACSTGITCQQRLDMEVRPFRAVGVFCNHALKLHAGVREPRCRLRQG